MLGPFIVPNEDMMHKKRMGRGNTRIVIRGRRALGVAKNVEGMDRRWRNHKMERMMSHSEHPKRSVTAPPSAELTRTGAKAGRSSSVSPHTHGPLESPALPHAVSV